MSAEEHSTNWQQSKQLVKIMANVFMATLSKKCKARRSVTNTYVKISRSTRGNTSDFSFHGMCFLCGLTTYSSAADSRKVLTKKENFDWKVHNHD